MSEPRTAPEPEEPREKARKKPREKRSFWRRIVRLGVILVAVLLVLRVVLWIGLPIAVRSVVAGLGLECEFSAIRLSVLDTSVELHDVVLRPPGAARPLARLRYARVDLDLMTTLSSGLRFARADIDGLELRVERGADGTFDLERYLAGEAGAAATSVDETETAPLNLELPFAAGSLRLRGVIDLRDASVSPALETRVHADLAVTDLGSPDRRSHLEVQLRAPGCVELVRVVGDARIAAGAIDARVALAVEHARTGPLAGHLAQLGLRPHRDELSLSAIASLSSSPGKAAAESRAKLTVRDVSVTSNGAELQAIDEVVAVVDALSSKRLAIDTVDVRGLRGRAERLATGELRIAGVDVLTDVEQEPAVSPSSAETGTPIAFSLRKLLAKDLALSWHDGAVTPAVTVPAVVTELVVRDIDSGAGSPCALELTAAAAGVAEKIGVRAQVAAFAARKTVVLDVDLAGVSATAVAPYLREIGFEPTLRSASLTTHVTGWVEPAADGSLAAGAAVEGLRLIDSGELFAAERIAVDRARIDPSAGTTEIGQVEVSGIRVRGQRDRDGAFAALGLRTIAVPAKVAEVGVSEATSAQSQRRLPRVRLAGLSWKDTKVHFLDATMSPPVTLALKDLAVEIGAISIGHETSSPPTPVRARMHGTNLLETVELTGTITPGANSVDCDLSVHGRGLATRQAMALWRSAGVEPQHEAVEFAVRVAAGIREVDQGLSGQLRLSDLRLTEDGEDLLAVKSLAVEEVDIRGGLRIGRVVLERPEVVIERHHGGELEVSGFRLLPGRTDAAKIEDAEQPSAGRPTKPLSLASVEVRELGVRWRDRAVTPAVDLRATVRAKLDGLTLAANAAPAGFELGVVIPDCVEQLTLAGELELQPGKVGVRSRVSGRGLRGKLLAGYLDGDSYVDGGRVELELDAGLVRAGDAWAAHARVSGFDFRANESEQVLGFERLAVEVPRLARDLIRVSEVSVKGLRARAVRDASGAVRALGMRLGTARSKRGHTGVAVAEDRPRETVTRVFPRVELRKLDLELVAIELVNEARASAVPLVASFRVATPKPFVLIDNDPEHLPPLELRVTGACEPVVGSIDLGLTLSPYSQSPEVNGEIAITGIHGGALARVWPSLSRRLDASRLEGGSLRASVQAFADWGRAGPVDFAVPGRFSAGLTVKGFEVRERADGPVVAGIETLRVHADRIAPASGEVRVSEVVIDNPTAVVTRQPDGLHALGVVLKMPEKPADGGAVASAEPVSQPALRLTKRGEVRVDELVVAGADLRYIDETVTPRMDVPINWMLLEVKRFSTRAFVDPRPVTFRLLATSGQVDLPKRKDGGLLQGAVGIVTGAGKAEVQKRPLLDSVNVRGRVTLGREPAGWVRADVQGLELTGFAGLAKRAGWSLQDGRLDARVVLGLEGAKGSKVESELRFFNLSVSEPANAPLSGALLLPVSLDSALWLLKRDGGEHQIPLSFEIPPGGISRSQIFGLAADSFRKLVTDAVARSPWRVTGAVTGLLGSTLGGVAGLFGLGGSDSAKEVSQIVATEPVEFALGDIGLDAVGRARLASLIEKLEADETLTVALWHGLSEADLARCEVLANPSPEQCRQLISRMRRRRTETQRKRDLVAAAARAHYSVGDTAAARSASDELRALEHEIGLIETALAEVYEHLLPGAARRRDRRTQRACLALGRKRLEVIRRTLIDAGVENRIEVVPPRLTTIEDETGRVFVRLRSRRE